MRPKLVLTAIVLSIVLAGQTAQAERTKPRSLEAQARWVASHGGITGSCWGCATPQMKRLSQQLTVRQFSRAGQQAVRFFLCVIHREAGENPGAVNSQSGAAGLFQFLGHPQFSQWGLTHDPVYQVRAAWRLSAGAKVLSHWDAAGQTYNC